ncbi:MAG: glutathione peroxidase [Pirellulaceae bacterium]|jgi:glutathione peroxidase
MSTLRTLSFLCAFVIAATAIAEEKKSASALDFKVKSISGKEVDLAKLYKGKVLLVVNTASQCGLTPQYEGLQALQVGLKDQPFAVLGFPCNQFGKQEPGDEKEIAEFCKSNYSVTFDMFSKVEVNGEGACGLYKYLTSVDTKPKGKGKVAWNFEKFLVGKDGQVVARFKPGTEPTSEEVLAAIKAELKK